MFLFALDNRPPSSIMLISGDVDFAPALHILGQRGYTIILVIPSGVGVSSALSNAGRFVWDWPSVARGEGFMTPTKALGPPRSATAEIAGLLVGCQINNHMEGGENEEESIVYRGISKSFYNTSVSQSPSEHNRVPILPPNSTSSRSHSLPSGLNVVSSGTLSSCDQNELTWVQPRDLNDLKGQLVKLLELSGGTMPLTRLPAEYQKFYGKPLYVSEYGAVKLANLLKKMADTISVDGKGQKKFVCIRNLKSVRVGTPVILARRNKNESGSQEDNIDVTNGVGSSEEFSDDEGVVVGSNCNGEGEKSNLEVVDQSLTIDQSLYKFKYEIQEILVSYSCRIFLDCFEGIYQQRYKRQLDYLSFGVNHLEMLLQKVRDIVMLQEEPISKRKYLVAVGG